MSVKISLILISAALFVCVLSGCKKADTSSDAKSSDILTVDDIGGNTPTPVIAPEIKLKEVKPAKKPESESIVCTMRASDADAFFAVQTCAVRGTVSKVREYCVQESYEGEAESKFYFSVLSVRVDEKYGEADLKYRKGGVIYVRYRQNTHDRTEGYPDLGKGDTCILFLQDIAVDPPIFMSLEKAVYDYDMVYPEQSVILKTANGYDAQEFMALFGKQERYYKLSEIEKVITKNADKMKGKSYMDIMFSNGVD